MSPSDANFKPTTSDDLVWKNSLKQAMPDQEFPKILQSAVVSQMQPIFSPILPKVILLSLVNLVVATIVCIIIFNPFASNLESIPPEVFEAIGIYHTIQKEGKDSLSLAGNPFVQSSSGIHQTLSDPSQPPSTQLPKEKIESFLKDKISFASLVGKSFIDEPVFRVNVVPIGDTQGCVLEYDLKDCRAGHFMFTQEPGHQAHTCPGPSSCKAGTLMKHTTEVYVYHQYTIITKSCPCGCNHIIVSETKNKDLLLHHFNKMLDESHHI